MAASVAESFAEVIRRLDQMQMGQSQMMERLDTVQNIIEIQSLEQSSMESQLSEITTKLEQEKIFMRDQLKDAQNQILERLQYIHPLPGGALQVNPCQVSRQETQTVCGGNDEVTVKLQILEQKTDLIKDEVIKMSQTCRGLTRHIESVLKDKITGLVTHAMENFLTSVAEIRSIPDVIRGHTRAELVWLVAQVDTRLSETDTNVSEKLFTLDREMIEQADQTRLRIEMLNKQHTQITEKLNKHRGQITEIITKYTEKVKEDILKHVTSCHETWADNWQNVKVELENVNISVTALREKADRMKTSMAAAVQKIESVETSVTVGQQTVRGNLVTITQQQDNMIKKLEESTQEAKDGIDRVKRQMIAVVEKESQLVRDRIQGPLPSLGKYTFDFYIENFKTLVRSGKFVDSFPWHINEMRSCVKGLAGFLENGNLRVWFMQGRHPREVGLQPCTTNVTLLFKATICDIYNKTLPDVELGEKNMPISESIISSNKECGYDIGMTSCDELITKGYGDKEGYRYKSLLIRFEVTVC